jgi:MoaA/NifB/PqqE/SkfB family radical SAM enzyme
MQNRLFRTVYQHLKTHPDRIPFRVLDPLWHFFRALHKMAPDATWIQRICLKILKQYNYAMNRLELARRREQVVSLPSHLNIETTVRCNLICPFCYRQTGEDGKTDHNAVPDMDDALFQTIVSNLFPTAKTINTSLSGEPFIATNLDRILDAAEQYGVKLHVVTNGTCLKPDNLPPKLIPNLHRIDFSIDSLDPDRFNNLRFPARFDRVIATFDAFAQARNAASTPSFDLGISFIIGRQNARELPDMVEFLAEKGGTHLVVGPLLVYDEKHREESLISEPDLYNSVYEKARKKAEKYLIHFEAPLPFSDEPDAESDISERSCELVYIQTLITTTGVVLPCCQYYPPRLGDLTQEDFRSIWNGKVIRTIRKTINTPHAITPCKDCYLIEAGARFIEKRRNQEYIFLSSKERKSQY